MFELDGRLARTLPLMFFGRALARDYMEGRLQRHVPPFRTFLVALLLFIFAAERRPRTGLGTNGIRRLRLRPGDAAGRANRGRAAGRAAKDLRGAE
jgi:hypothetical protein